MMISGGEQIGHVEQIDVLHAPAVAEVRNMIYARPRYLADQPIAVQPQLWHEAQEQLRQLLAARGWPLSTSGSCDRVNFLLCGVPVVMSGD